MRRFTKSLATICPVRPASRRSSKRLITGPSAAPLSALEDQLALFIGGASGRSKKALRLPNFMRNQRLRKSSTLFVTLVTMFSPFRAMGMYVPFMPSAMRKDTHPDRSLFAVNRSA